MGFFACVYVYAEPMEARIGCRTPEMELHMVGRHHVGAGNLTSISERAERSLNHWTISPELSSFFFFLIAVQQQALLPGQNNPPQWANQIRFLLSLESTFMSNVGCQCTAVRHCSCRWGTKHGTRVGQKQGFREQKPPEGASRSAWDTLRWPP